MRVAINAAERSLAVLAVDLGDKMCDRARAQLAELHVDGMMVMTLQGIIAEMRRELRDTKQREYDWGFEQRRALAICLMIYRDQLDKLVTKEEKLEVVAEGAKEKRRDIRDFLARLHGQESFWRATEREDDAQRELVGARD